MVKKFGTLARFKMFNYIISRIFRSAIVDMVDKHVKDPKIREESIEGLTEAFVLVANVVGYRRLWKLWRSMKKEGIMKVDEGGVLRVSYTELNSVMGQPQDATKDG